MHTCVESLRHMVILNESLKQKIHSFISLMGCCLHLGFATAEIIDEGLMFLFICPVSLEEVKAMPEDTSVRSGEAKPCLILILCLQSTSFSNQPDIPALLD